MVYLDNGSHISDYAFEGTIKVYSDGGSVVSAKNLTCGGFSVVAA
jgi:hypothetical protein